MVNHENIVESDCGNEEINRRIRNLENRIDPLEQQIRFITESVTVLLNKFDGQLEQDSKQVAKENQQDRSVSHIDQNTENDELLVKLLEALREKVNKPAFDTWLSPVKIVKRTDSEIFIATPNDFVKGWLECHYEDTIQDIFKQITGNLYKIEFMVFEPEEILLKNIEKSTDYLDLQRKYSDLDQKELKSLLMNLLDQYTNTFMDFRYEILKVIKMLS